MTTAPLIPYIRRSRADEEKVSIEDQRRAIREWAERAGVTLAPEVQEPLGTSGRIAWRERELGAVIERCRRGEAAGVVVAYFSRLTRERMSATWEVLEELEPHRLMCVREGYDKAPGERANLIAAVHGYQAQDEWQVLRGNLQKGKHSTWERGGQTGPAPAGYAKDGVRLVKTDHADAIGRALRVKAGGGSWAEVARSLTAAGVGTCRGATVWSVQACRALARNPIYRGVLRCTCGCGGEAFRPELAVVTRSTWDAAQPLTGAGMGRKDAGTALLAGMLVCAECGSRLTITRRTRGNQAAYRCSGGLKCTSHATVSAAKVEPLIREATLGYLMATEPTAGHEPDVETLARLEHEADVAKERLAALVRILDPLDPGAEERLEQAREEVRLAEAALVAEGEARAERISEEEARRAFEEASVDEQRQLLRMYLHGATVAAGDQTEPVESRVEVHYRALAWAA